MRAAQVESLTGPAGLRVMEIAEPASEGMVVIEVEVAGVSFADLLMSQGLYQSRSAPPFTPGMDAAGVVRSAPPGSGLKAGDRVCTSTTGAFAEVAVATPGRVFKLPDVLSFAQGAALTVNYQTAIFCLVDRGGFRAGESVLVLGASGGVGTSAIQVAKGLGASKVVGVVSTVEKAKVAKDAGADEVVLLASDWKDAALALTGGDGFDVVYDPVGADLFLDGLRCLGFGGRLVVVGFAGGAIPEVKVNRLLLNNISVVGAAWGEATRRDSSLPRRIHQELVGLIESGFVRPPIGQVFALEDIAAAYRTFENREAVGKVVLRIR